MEDKAGEFAEAGFAYPPPNQRLGPFYLPFPLFLPFLLTFLPFLLTFSFFALQKSKQKRQKSKQKICKFYFFALQKKATLLLQSKAKKRQSLLLTPLGESPSFPALRPQSLIGGQRWRTPTQSKIVEGEKKMERAYLTTKKKQKNNQILLKENLIIF